MYDFRVKYWILSLHRISDGVCVLKCKGYSDEEKEKEYARLRDGWPSSKYVIVEGKGVE